MKPAKALARARTLMHQLGVEIDMYMKALRRLLTDLPISVRMPSSSHSGRRPHRRSRGGWSSDYE